MIQAPGLSGRRCSMQDWDKDVTGYAEVCRIISTTQLKRWRGKISRSGAIQKDSFSFCLLLPVNELSFQLLINRDMENICIARVII